MNCEVIINGLTRSEWEQYAKEFSDYSIYQTWAYQQVRTENDKQKLCQILIRNGCVNPATMCQMRIKIFKPLGLKIGYIQWGPLIRDNKGQINCTIEMLSELRKSLFNKHLNILRVVPNIRNDIQGQKITKIFESAGFESIKSINPYHTMILSLEEPEEILRDKIHQSWRRKLKKAENAGIVIKENEDLKAAFEILEKYYEKIVERKKIKGLDVQQFARSQQLLSSSEKMHVIIAYYQGEPVAVHVTSVIGDTGILLIVASNEKGYQCGASYLVWWKSVMACKSRGLKQYDVGGVDFQNNPTVSQFKAGMGGEDCEYIGTFEACNCSLTKLKWRVAEKTFNFIKGRVNA